jgi:site-specific DNA-methyltransferase (adenine-specific)
VDLILADLPYGKTDCAWDVPLPLPRLWRAYRRVMKPTAAIILTAVHPFTAKLGHTKPPWLKYYEVIWGKTNGTTPLTCHDRPMSAHENILVFYAKQPTYTPQKTFGHKTVRAFADTTKRLGHIYRGAKGDKGPTSWHRANADGSRYPLSLQWCDAADEDAPGSVVVVAHDRRGDHATPKPVELLGWLIRSFTTPGAVVLDNTMGAGSTGIACMQTGRRFLGIEKEATFFAQACERLAAPIQQTTLLAASG